MTREEQAIVDELRGEVERLEIKNRELQNEIEDLTSRGQNAAERLVAAVRAELDKFTFPEEDRPELYDAWCAYEESL